MSIQLNECVYIGHKMQFHYSNKLTHIDRHLNGLQEVYKINNKLFVEMIWVNTQTGILLIYRTKQSHNLL